MSTSPPPASNIDDSSTHITTSTPANVDVGTSTQVANDAEMTQLSLESDTHQDLNHPHRIAKCNKYVDDYSRYVQAKYFSKKNLFGGDIFQTKTTIGEEIIWASRWPCTWSFVDPAGSFEDLTRSTSVLSTEAPSISNEKQQTEND